MWNEITGTDPFGGARAGGAGRDEGRGAQGDGFGEDGARGRGLLVPPRAQIERRQGAAGHARVQEIVRQVEDGARQFADRVRILADDAREGHFADLGQLGLAEATRLVVVLVPEPVAASQSPELVTDDAAEGRTHHTALQRRLYQTASPQVDVIHRRVHLL